MIWGAHPYSWKHPFVKYIKYFEIHITKNLAVTIAVDISNGLATLGACVTERLEMMEKQRRDYPNL